MYGTFKYYLSNIQKEKRETETVIVGESNAHIHNGCVGLRA